MADLFGVASGIQQSTRDQDAHMLAGIAADDTISQIQARGLSMQKEQIGIDTAKLALQNQKNFQTKMQQMHAAGHTGGGDGASAGDPLSAARDQTNGLVNDFQSMAGLALDSGLPEQAKDYATAASGLQKGQAALDQQAFNRGMKNLNLIDKLLPSVHDDASWKQANMIFQTETGHKSPFADHPYSPELIKQLQSATATSKDKALTQAANARAAADEAKARESKMRTDVLIPTQAQLNKDRDAALVKTGAKDKIPKAADIKAITDLAIHSFDIDATDPKQMADIRVQARPIAERMNEIMKENPGMKQSEAAQRAFKEFNARGDFAGLDKNKSLPGASAKTALPLPKDQAKAKDNHWYTINGKPMYLDHGQLYTADEVAANAKDVENESTQDDEEDDNEGEE